LTSRVPIPGHLPLPAKLANPARRALASAGCTSLDSLCGFRRSEVSAWHGIGPNALRLLGAALAEHGLQFAPEPGDQGE
jgi:hypothetical protein